MQIPRINRPGTQTPGKVYVSNPDSGLFGA